MATDLGRAKTTSANKYDAFVTAQLTQAEKRIRFLDLTAGLLGYTALALVYIVALVLLDSKLVLSSHTRQLALYAFLAGSAVYLFFAVVRPLRWRVNPYYAARQVEQQVPEAKNSIVNWVDLHSQPLPPAIRGALGQRAAKDMAHVDLDQAISGRRAAWMGGIAGLCTLAFIIAFFAVGPAPFLSLLKRAFNPFAQVGVSTRTQLTLLKPEGGNATITVGRGINFAVAVNGKVPNPKAADAVKLLYRYEESEPWQERVLIQEPSREWTTSLSAIEVKNGFWYRITGGDASTEEYRVRVRATPAITDFLVTYHFRPYVARADEVRHERDLKALRGTSVQLRVRTNRTLRDGRIDFEGKKGAKTERGAMTVDPADPQTLLVFLVLDEDGKYRLHFTSTDGEAYSDPVAHTMTAIPDNPPTVELTKPGQDIRLPADAILHLEGKAGDDIGVKSLELHMEVVGGDRLKSQRYRSDEEMRLPDGGYPREVEYKDFVELSRVKNQQGQPVALRAGMELEYWLEASDACDFPLANLTRTKRYRVLLTEPEKNEAKREEEKKQAEKDKKQHEQKQDQKRQEENKQRQEERQNQEAKNKEEENKNKDANQGQGGAGQSSQEKNGEQSGNADNKDNGEKQPGEGNNGQGEKNELSKEDQKTEEQVQKALDKKEQGKGGAGQSNPDKGEQGNNNSTGDKDKSPSEGKNADQKDAKGAGESKDKGEQQPGANQSPSESKGDNSPRPMPGDKNNQGESKGSDAKSPPGANQAGENKPSAGQENKSKSGNAGSQPDAKQSGENKPSSGDKQGDKNASQTKPQPMGQGSEAANGDKKSADDKGSQNPRNSPAEDKKNNEKGNSETKGQRPDKGDGKSEEKSGDSSAKGRQSPSEAKPPGERKNEDGKATPGERKSDAEQQARKATPKEVEDLARKLDSKDPEERKEAQRKLQQIQKDARDPQARDKAEESLKKAGQPDGPADNGTGSPKPDDGSAGKPNGEPKNGDKNGSKNSSGKGSEGDDGKGSSSDGKNGQGNKGGKKGDGSGGNGRSQGTESSDGGNRAGGGGERRGGEGDNAGQGDTNAPTRKPDKPGSHAATQMQLEDFAKRVNKDILKEAGVSEEAWKKYLEAKRKQLAPREPSRPDTPVDPRQANALPSMGGKTIQSKPGDPGNTSGANRGQPPPGYRDPVREFYRQMSNKSK